MFSMSRHSLIEPVLRVKRNVRRRGDLDFLSKKGRNMGKELRGEGDQSEKKLQHKELGSGLLKDKERKKC